jgi:hypothetical protein
MEIDSIKLQRTKIQMNADHAFYIGNTHAICQDYALSGTVENGAYAIVCDGCSQSPDVDFGARALALSAKRTLMIGGADMSADIFGKITIDNIKTIEDYFPLNARALDATLLVAFVRENYFKVHMFGDGLFFHKSPESLRLIHVDYESNHPAYLSYYLDKLRQKHYEDTVFGSKHIWDITLFREDSSEMRDSVELEDYTKPFVPTTYEGIVKPGDIIGVVSDGINSFKRGSVSEIGWNTMIQEFIDIKSKQGVFVQRRLGFLKRQWAKNLIGHSDDISMASIVV